MGRTIQFAVADEVPPVKGEAKSMLSEGHKQPPRVRALVAAAHTAKRNQGFEDFYRRRIGLELTVRPPRPTDPVVGRDQQSRRCRGTCCSPTAWLWSRLLWRRCRRFSLYHDDAQIREVHYREKPGALGYTVHV